MDCRGSSIATFGSGFSPYTYPGAYDPRLRVAAVGHFHCWRTFIVNAPGAGYSLLILGKIVHRQLGANILP